MILEHQLSDITATLTKMILKHKNESLACIIKALLFTAGLYLYTNN